MIKYTILSVPPSENMDIQRHHAQEPNEANCLASEGQKLHEQRLSTVARGVQPPDPPVGPVDTRTLCKT